MIEDIKKRLATITTGEWESEPEIIGDDVLRGYRIFAGTDEPILIASLDAHGARDAEFIAHAPADLRWAVAEVERLQQEVDLRQALDVTPKLMQQLSVANATAQTVPPLLERIGQLEADTARLRDALDCILHTSSRTAIYKIADQALKGKG